MIKKYLVLLLLLIAYQESALAFSETTFDGKLYEPMTKNEQIIDLSEKLILVTGAILSMQYALDSIPNSYPPGTRNAIKAWWPTTYNGLDAVLSILYLASGEHILVPWLRKYVYPVNELPAKSL
jgi:hypothetical protein